MGVRAVIAIIAAKAASAVSKKTGKEGYTLAGKIAMMLYPGILAELAGQVREGIIVVCGTNGKTTTNNLLCSALEAEGKKVVCNHTGANMLNGAAAAFVLGAAANGKLDADFACIEVDEASTRLVFPHLHPDLFLLTNLFRDQLDRYGEIDTTMQILEDCLKANPGMQVIVNGDDPLSACLAVESPNPVTTYGIENPVEKTHVSEIREGRFCRRCGKKLRYDFYHYGQLGKYTCPSCGFSRPKLDVTASDISLSDHIAMTAAGEHLEAEIQGLYNVYNILAAFTAVIKAGIKPAHFAAMLQSFHSDKGRMESFIIGKNRVVLSLAKNPAGFNQNISAVLQDKKPKDLILAINDHAQDGTDVSWLWDVDFDTLSDPAVRSITVSGLRCRDMQLRLKYVDIPSKPEPSVKQAIRSCLEEGTGNLYVLVNYTVLHSTHQFLQHLAGKTGKP